MAELLTVVAEEMGRIASLVWSGVGVAVRLNNQVMTTILKASARVVQLLLLLTHKAADLFSLLFADLLLFLNDIGTCVLTLIIALQTAVCTVYSFISGAVMTVCSAAVYSCHLIHSSYCGMLSGIVLAASHLGDLVVAIKHAFILFGSSVLFIISFLPNLIYLVFMGLLNLCSYTYLSCSQKFNNFLITTNYAVNNLKTSLVNFLFSIPVDFVVGVIAAVAVLIALKKALFYMMDNMILIPDIPVPSMILMLRRRFIRWYVAIVREAHRRPPIENDTEEEELEDDANDENGNDSNDNVPDLNLPQNQAFAYPLNPPDPIPIGIERLENHRDVPVAPIIPPALARPPITRQRTRQLAQEAVIIQPQSEPIPQPETSAGSLKGPGREVSNKVDVQTYQLYRELEQERESQLCIVCQDQVKCVILLPCRHLCLCDACRSAIITRDNICPVCRRPILETIRVYV
ncbi:uncharacterized protein LOC135198049 [Macrobrachium nipponense]|uniref:uncharacterized protein LOC135198049 n=1 Tax=Macrobrachium nipponense TaxID=159736 RepID=UPI0030C7DDA4